MPLRSAACAVLLASACLGLTACGTISPSLVIENEASDLYSPEEIEQAIDAVERKFVLEFDGCTLMEMGYAGDELSQFEYEYHAEHTALSPAAEYLVLTSTFLSPPEGRGEGTWNPDTLYEGWQWILYRENGGPWTVSDWGYG
ncbi:MAG: hypothetical protein UCH28_12175 [Adlercreutzia sp.]|nr:hypothetical protein [Adlercreutzia sp.]